MNHLKPKSNTTKSKSFHKLLAIIKYNNSRKIRVKSYKSNQFVSKSRKTSKRQSMQFLYLSLVYLNSYLHLYLYLYLKFIIDNCTIVNGHIEMHNAYPNPIKKNIDGCHIKSQSKKTFHTK